MPRFSDGRGPGRGQNGPGFPVAGGTPAANKSPRRGAAVGRETAREAYYHAITERTELANGLRRAELLEREAVRQAWGRMVLTLREGLLNLSAVALQRGIVTREREPELQTLVDDVLAQLGEAGR